MKTLARRARVPSYITAAPAREHPAAHTLQLSLLNLKSQI